MTLCEMDSAALPTLVAIPNLVLLWPDKNTLDDMICGVNMFNVGYTLID